jgi:hypothetical protein
MTEQEIEKLFDSIFGFNMPEEGESRRVVREDIMAFANSLLQAQQAKPKQVLFTYNNGQYDVTVDGIEVCQVEDHQTGTESFALDPLWEELGIKVEYDDEKYDNEQE